MKKILLLLSLIASPAYSENIQFYFSETTVVKGEQATINWRSNVGNPLYISCFVSGIPGLTSSVGAAGNFTFTAQGSITASIQCMDQFSLIGFNNASLDVINNPKPIVEVDFPQEVIVEHKLYDLKITTQHANTCQLRLSEQFNFFEIGTSFEDQVIYDKGVHTQTVKCQGTGGETIVEREVRVGYLDTDDTPVIHYFYNSDLSLNTGATHLIWATSKAQSCKLKSGNVTDDVHITSLAYSNDGYRVFIPVGGKSFTLTCYNNGLSAKKDLFIPRASSGGIGGGGVIIR
ncbi:MAG: hypothetical protein HWE16_00135 [Gammaproteobacteria bacterium]|nr:hypothetical protein [Gammaproteobacteria bacterium]